MDSTKARRPGSRAATAAESTVAQRPGSQAATAAESTDPKLLLPPAAIELLGSLYRQFSQPVVAFKMWERCFTEEERQELDNNFYHALSTWGTLGMWQRVRGSDRYSAAVRIAFSLGRLTRADYEWLLRLLGEVSNAELNHLVASARLVIVEYPRQLFWEHEKVEINWETKPAKWNYLISLVEGAKKGQVFDRLSLSDEKEADYLSKIKSQLKSIRGFPGSLADCIKPAGRGSQRLTINPDQLVIVKSNEGPM